MNHRQRLRRGLALSALCALVTACGSTVQVTGQRSTATDGLGGGGSSSSGAATDPGADGQVGGSQSSTTSPSSSSGSSLSETTGSGAGSSTGGSTGSQSGPAATGTSSSSGSSSTGASSPSAFNPKVFKIGVMTSSNANTALAAIGSGTADGQGYDNASQAILNYVNAHGGIAGRKVVVAINDVDSTASPQSQSQKACAQWVQDDHVTLALPSSAVEDNDVLRACLGKAGIPTLLGPIYSNTVDKGFASSPLWAENQTLSTEAYARTYIRGLAAQGFFKNAKVGVVYYDGNPFSGVLTKILLPELKAAGISNPVTAGASISGLSDLSSGSAAMSNAVLKFRSAGVNKVLFFEPWVGYFSFLQNAQSQGYSPTYGLSSQEAPEVVKQLGLVSAKQLKGARLVSWTPVGDLGNYSAQYQGPLTATCNAIFKAAGVTPAGQGSRLDYALQYGACEALIFLQSVYKNAPHTLSGSDFTRGINALGSTFPLALKPKGTFSPTKHYAVSQYWNGHFDDGCACFVYDGAPHPIP